MPFDLDVALRHQLLVVAIRAQGLPQCEDMLRPVIADQGLADGDFRRVNPPVAQGRQFGGVSLARENGIEDREAGHSREVADHVMQLQIHLIQRLLHALDVGGGGLNETLAMAEQRT